MDWGLDLRDLGWVREVGLWMPPAIVAVLDDFVVVVVVAVVGLGFRGGDEVDVVVVVVVVGRWGFWPVRFTKVGWY